MELILLVAAFLIAGAFTPKVLEMLKDGGIVRKNYLNDVIPQGAGLIFISVLAVILVSYIIVLNGLPAEGYIYFGFISIACLIGFVDDVAGNSAARGFKGHFTKAIKEGKLTTGFWKACIGGITAFFAASLISSSWLELIIHTLIVALATNLFNLFDVRPGRSIKAFLLGSVLVVLFSPGNPLNIVLYPLIGTVLAYYRQDISRLAMMGDTGANVLGMTLGLALINVGYFTVKLLILLTLFSLHVLSEYKSFSEIIDNNRLLRMIDRVGRRE